MDTREILKQWFTETQVKRYFGTRSADELAAIAERMQAMSSDGRRRFKKQLAVLAWKQSSARQYARRGKSAFGQLLVGASAELKR